MIDQSITQAQCKQGPEKVTIRERLIQSTDRHTEGRLRTFWRFLYTDAGGSPA